MQKKEGQAAETVEAEIRRIILPRGRQNFGIIVRMLGASRVEVKCFDGRTRLCRIPGRLKRKIWVRPGDLVIVEPWELGGEEKGDIIFRYTGTQVGWLRSHGKLPKVEGIEEF